VLADRYRVEKELGRGGMAMVYLAQDLRHERKVALKVLRPELAAAIGPDRFLQEIKVTANLQHPHILGLIDSGQADGAVYYVMPYVDGETPRWTRGRGANERFNHRTRSLATPYAGTESGAAPRNAGFGTGPQGVSRREVPGLRLECHRPG
jgi:serine/threonine protein kinase